MNIPIFSLRTAHVVGTAVKPILNPNNLKIEAWFAESRFEGGLLLLPSSEIRELSRQGIAVNDQDAITPAEDLVRLEPLARLDFQLIGKKVETDLRRKLGKVDDYSTETSGFYVQKIYVRPTALRAFSQKPTMISRSQIVEINDKKIIVKDTSVPLKSLVKAPAPVQ